MNLSKTLFAFAKKSNKSRIFFIFVYLLGIMSAWSVSMVSGGPTNNPELRAQFFQLCDLATVKMRDENSKGPFFVDSYAVRALCAAYDMSGNTNYLDACREWSERMVKYQEQMIPRGAYYMHYNRKPGETTNDWYVADSSSIGMAVLATSVRCKGAEQKRFLMSAANFADLVTTKYFKPSGGISDGLWHGSGDEWWCSSALFGSFLFNLYSNTGNKHYLMTALKVTDWLNQWEPTKDQPFPLSQQGPAMIFYVMENYSAGWPYIAKDAARKKAALAKINWCFDWIMDQQQTPLAGRPWPPTKGWGMKFGGLPFHEYVFGRYLPEDQKLAAAGDAEMRFLIPITLTKPEPTQLLMFTLLSCAERLNPGAIYQSAHVDSMKR